MKKIKNFFKNSISLCIGGFKNEKRLLRSHVERDWVIMTSAFLMVLFFVFVFNAYLFFSCGKELKVETLSENNSEYFIDKDKMDVIIQKIEQKKLNLESVRRGEFKNFFNY